MNGGFGIERKSLSIDLESELKPAAE